MFSVVFFNKILTDKIVAYTCDKLLEYRCGAGVPPAHMRPDEIWRHLTTIVNSQHAYRERMLIRADGWKQSVKKTGRGLVVFINSKK